MIKYIFLLFIFSLGGTSGFTQSYNKATTDQKFSTLLHLLNEHYMDSADLGALTETAIRSALKELDPHSVYIAAKDVEKTNEPLVGSYEGVGISYHLFRDTILVISATPGGPSEKAGIQGGDKIIRINDEPAVGKQVDEGFVRERLRGKRGSSVMLSVLRQGMDSLLDFTVKRDKIPLQTIVASYMMDESTAYIRLSRFSNQSAKDFNDELVRWKDKGMERLVFDLRGNSGGYMNVAVDIASEFLERGQVVVYTSGLRSPRQDYAADGKGIFSNGKVVLLIDEGSASASEIVAGALQDWDRALLVGRRTYGKGLVQKPYYLTDGSQVRITTARYYTPSNRCIQRPYTEGNERYFKEFSRRLQHGEFLTADSIHLPDSLRYTTQGGRVVYGGGGIMPDVFMGIDSAYLSNYYDQLIRKGVLNEYCLDYLDQHRVRIRKQFRDKDDFVARFECDTAMLHALTSLATEKGIARVDAEIQRSSPLIRQQVKASLARNLHGISAYHEVMNLMDPLVIKAREVLNLEQPFPRLSQE